MSPDSEIAIEFFSEDIDFDLADQEQVITWLNAVSEAESADIQELTYVFCSDNYLLEINKQYLAHDTLTDVITFDYAEEEGVIEGDVFISIERIRENASGLGIATVNELHRVMVHGLLHLLGYSDKVPEAQKEMRAKEDFYLNLRPFSA